MILNFINTNLPKLKQSTPCFESLCLPGLTEEYKLNIFLHLESETALKVIFASDENSNEILEDFENVSKMIVKEFDQ